MTLLPPSSGFDSCKRTRLCAGLAATSAARSLKTIQIKVQFRNNMVYVRK
jgi:hypothetical protein